MAVGEHLGRLSRLDEVLDLWNVWWANRQIVQPESFWRRRIYERVGDFRTDLYIVFDYEYWCRMLSAGAVFQSMDKGVACFRMQPAQKTSDTSRTAEEEVDVIKSWLWNKKVPLPAARRKELQGQWLYHKVFLSTVENSVKRGESKFRRWARLVRVCARHPQVLAAPSFRHRLRSVFGVSL